MIEPLSGKIAGIIPVAQRNPSLAAPTRIRRNRLSSATVIERGKHVQDDEPDKKPRQIDHRNAATKADNSKKLGGSGVNEQNADFARNGVRRFRNQKKSAAQHGNDQQRKQPVQRHEQ